MSFYLFYRLNVTVIFFQRYRVWHPDWHLCCNETNSMWLTTHEISVIERYRPRWFLLKVLSKRDRIFTCYFRSYWLVVLILRILVSLTVAFVVHSGPGYTDKCEIMDSTDGRFDCHFTSTMRCTSTKYCKEWTDGVLKTWGCLQSAQLFSEIEALLTVWKRLGCS